LLIDLSGRHGLRPAEARALRWSRVDLEARTLRIDAQINRRIEIVKAKTKRSVRTILPRRRSVLRSTNAMSTGHLFSPVDERR
jgi:integrase